jgi:hypothetical protein
MGLVDARHLRQVGQSDAVVEMGVEVVARRGQPSRSARRVAAAAADAGGDELEAQAFERQIRGAVGCRELPVAAAGERDQPGILEIRNTRMCRFQPKRHAPTGAEAERRHAQRPDGDGMRIARGMEVQRAGFEFTQAP